MQGDAYKVASAKQKCEVAKLLLANNFAINYEKWEKEAKKDEQEWLKVNKDRGHQDFTKSQENEIVKAKAVEAADYDFRYCAQCGKTTKHMKNKSGSLVCQECGVERKKTASNVIGSYIKSQIEQARPNVVQLVIQKLIAQYNQFKTPLAPFDIQKQLTDVVNQNFQGPEAQEELSYLAGNDAVMDQI